MIKIGILGFNENLLETVEIMQKTALFSIVGIYYANDETKSVAKKNNFLVYSDPNEFINDIDFFYLFGTCADYKQVIDLGLKNSKHLFIEDIGIQDIEEIDELVKIAEESNSIIRYRRKGFYSPPIFTIKDKIDAPKYINITRNILKKGLSLKSLIFDYLIYDIDVALEFINSSVRKITASGYSFIANEIDFVSVKFEFINGSLLNMELDNTNTKELYSSKVYQYKKVYLIEGNNVSCKEKTGDLKTIELLKNSKEVIASQFEDLHHLISNNNKIHFDLYDNISILTIASKVFNIIESIRI